MRSATIIITFLLGLVVGRKIGWGLSKTLLYASPMAVCAILCIIWGVLVAYATRWFIEWQMLGTVLKIIMYGAGGYISIPNYGLFREDTIPYEAQAKHQFITALPSVAFVIASVVLAFLMKRS
jgi:hypothetical protein